MNKLFGDLKTDEEKSAFFLSGRGYETGVIAAAIQNDVAMAYHRCAEYKKELAALQAEFEKLRKDAAGLVEALDGAARSLETISKLAGRDEYMQEMIEVRGYASSRAAVARSALSAHREQQGGDV